MGAGLHALSGDSQWCLEGTETTTKTYYSFEVSGMLWKVVFTDIFTLSRPVLLIALCHMAVASNQIFLDKSCWTSLTPIPSVCSTMCWRSLMCKRTESPGPQPPPATEYHSLYIYLCHCSVLITKEISGKEENKSLRIWSSPEQDHNGQFAKIGLSNFPLWWWWGYEIGIIAQELPSLKAAKKTPAIIEGQGLVVFLTMELKPHPSLPSRICIFFWKPHIEYL